MANKVGALTLPAPAATAGRVVTDPGLEVLADFFRTVLSTYLETAWRSVAPAEPVVRSVYTHDPAELDFRANDLPLLCVWPERDARPKRLADGYHEAETTLQVLWMPPPVPQHRGSPRFPFFSGFDKVMHLVALNERDRSWVHEDDAADAAALAYGSDLHAHAGIDWWLLNSVQRVPVEVPSPGGNDAYPSYLATWTIAEATDTDNSTLGVHPTVIRFDETTGGDEPLTTNQAIVPDPNEE